MNTTPPLLPDLRSIQPNRPHPDHGLKQPFKLPISDRDKEDLYAELQVCTILLLLLL